MFDARRLLAATAVMFGLGIMLPVQAHAIDLSGAWATDAGLCSRVFTQKGKPVAFAELSDLFGSGFIIEGDRIRGKNARCAIKSRKQEGDNLELSAACATTIMTSNVVFSLKVIDDNNISRSFPEIPGMTIKYTRCTL